MDTTKIEFMQLEFPNGNTFWVRLSSVAALVEPSAIKDHTFSGYIIADGKELNLSAKSLQVLKAALL